MVSFWPLHSHLKILSNNDLKGTCTEYRFKRASATLFGQDLETFTGTMFLNMDQLEKQLDNKEFQEIGSMASFKVLETRFQMFIKSRIYLDDEYVTLTRNYFLEYTQLEISEFRGSNTWNLPIYDEEPLAEVQTTAEINVFAIGQQHTEQPEFNNKGEVDQNAEQCHETCPLPAKLTDNQTTELSNQFLKSENIFDVNNDLSKPVTTHYLPKERESAVVKPHHVIASSESRNSSKNMPRFSSNDMVHNHYLEEAKTKTQESGRNSRSSVMPYARSQSTANGSKPKPRINNQNSRNWPASKCSFVTTKTVPIAEHSRNSRNFSDSKHFVCSTCQKCVFNANHDT
ncbi:hypothetical protein Tco_0754320 [Tanacetum coccineum]